MTATAQGPHLRTKPSKNFQIQCYYFCNINQDTASDKTDTFELQIVQTKYQLRSPFCRLILSSDLTGALRGTLRYTATKQHLETLLYPTCRSQTLT